MKPIAANTVVLSRAVAEPAAATVRWAVPATQGSAHLTPRQLEVLALLCEGLPNKLICRRLNIATGTVKVHIGCILRELGVASRLQAVVAARSRGLNALVAADTPEEYVLGAAVGQAAKGAPVHSETASRPIGLGI